MTTSTNKAEQKGRIADWLTISRVAVAPIMVAIIIYGWPVTGWALVATIVFALAALTDFFDDVIGGKETSKARVFGWFDDIADSLLTMSTLVALAYVLFSSSALHWTLIAPLVVLAVCFGLAGVMRTKLLDNGGGRLADWAGALAQLATAFLIATPWLSAWINSLRSQPDDLSLFTPWVWQIGLLVLAISAVLSLVSLFRLLKAQSS